MRLDNPFSFILWTLMIQCQHLISFLIASWFLTTLLTYAFPLHPNTAWGGSYNVVEKAPNLEEKDPGLKP